MDGFGFCQAWSDELKELSRKHYRAACRVRNLEGAIDRTDPADFDDLMNQLETAQQEVYAAAEDFRRAKAVWDSGSTPQCGG